MSTGSHDSSYGTRDTRNNLEKVREFHEKFGAAIDQPFEVNSYKLRELRRQLIAEEGEEAFKELMFDDPDVDLPPSKKDLTKELADILYVVYGTAVTFGLPLQEVFEEVHRSNMSKLDENGKPILRADGKILKSSLYKEPDLEKYFAS